MDLPERINLRNTLHGHGAKGMAFYGYEEVTGTGISMEARRENGRSSFVETWYFDALPGQGFPSYKALRDAVAPLTEADIEAQTRAKYPLIKQVEPDSCGNHCRLCPRPPFVPGQGRQHYDTWRFTIARSWRDLTACSLCNTHMAQYEKDPQGLLDALKARVEALRANAKPLLPGDGGVLDGTNRTTSGTIGQP